jgi:hypothetical protein
MTTSDLLRLAWDHREAIAGAVLTLLGWSAKPPAWLVRLRRFPFACTATVLRWSARILDGVAGLEHPSTEAPSASHPEAAGTTTTEKETL